MKNISLYNKMERKRKVCAVCTPYVWDHFDLLTANKFKCRICSAELSYTNKSTSSMFRHYRAKHENEETNTPRMTTASRNIVLDQAVLNFIIKDCQPLSIVGSEGFRELVQVLDPSYVLPTRKTIKELIAKKHAEELERVKMEVQQLWQKRVAAARLQDPLTSWGNRKTSYPNLFHLALQFLCTPASPVPCECVFSKAGEMVSEKRNMQIKYHKVL